MFLLYAAGVVHEAMVHFQRRVDGIAVPTEDARQASQVLTRFEQDFDQSVIDLNDIALLLEIPLYVCPSPHIAAMESLFCVQEMRDTHAAFQQRAAALVVRWQHLKQYLENLDLPYPFTDHDIIEEALPKISQVIFLNQKIEMAERWAFLLKEIMCIRTFYLTALEEGVFPYLLSQTEDAEFLQLVYMPTHTPARVQVEAPNTVQRMLATSDKTIAYAQTFIRLLTHLKERATPAENTLLRERFFHAYQEKHANIPPELQASYTFEQTLDLIMRLLNGKVQEVLALIQQAEIQLLS